MISLRSPQWFLGWLCLLTLFQSMILSGLFAGSVSTLERMYGFSSFSAGLIAMAYELCLVVLLPLTSYFGDKGNKVKWIGVGGLILSVGMFMFILPLFFGEKYKTGQDTTDLPICNLDADGEPECTSASTQHDMLALFALAMVVIGIGAAPLYPLGPSHLDEVSPRKDFPLYLGFFFATSALGPAVGFLVSGAFLHTWVYPDEAKDLPDNLDTSHPAWVGAWWIGFVFTSIGILIPSVVLIFFPQSMPPLQPEAVVTMEMIDVKEKSDHDDDVKKQEPVATLLRPSDEVNENALEKEEEEEEKKKKNEVADETPGKEQVSFNENTMDVNEQNDTAVPEAVCAVYVPIGRELWAATKEIIMNKCWVCCTLGSILELMLVTGGITFLAKILQSMFSFTAGQASFLVGLVAVPGAAGGIFFGGWLMHRLHATPKENALFTLKASVFCTLLSFVFLIRCVSPPLAGVNTAYSFDGAMTGKDLELNDACNADCFCAVNEFTPVCDDYGVMYFNPCMAGCTDVLDAGETWTNCSCLAGLESMTVTLGKCEAHCDSSGLVIYLLAIFLVMFSLLMNDVPLNTVLMRTVNQRSRGYSLGLQQQLGRGLGNVPAPLIWGGVLDSTCALWATDCDGNETSCWEYDTYTMGLMLVVLVLMSKVPSTILFFMAYHYYEEPDDGEEAVNDNDPAHEDVKIHI